MGNIGVERTCCHQLDYLSGKGRLFWPHMPARRHRSAKYKFAMITKTLGDGDKTLRHAIGLIPMLAMAAFQSQK
jgi:hypothetical protein